MITQKLNYLALALLCVASVFADVDTDRSCRKKVICADTVKATTICADELIVKTGCCACRTITAKDFMDADGNLSQTFVIAEPGKYCLGENIDFAPAEDAGFVAAIQILSSDVKLDLCCNTLRQVNDIEDVYGVQIGYGYQIFFDDTLDPALHFDNITITNGNITNFKGVGIFCYNPTFVFLEEPFAFQSYILTDLNILDGGTSPSFNYFASGINLDSDAVDALFGEPSVEAYNNVIIDTCKVNRLLGNGSIGLHIGNNCVIQNTQANDLSTDGEVDVHPNVGGVFNYNIICNNFQMLNCQGNVTNHLDPEPNFGQVGGMSLEICENVYVKDCQFNDFFGEAVAIVNNNFSICSNSVFENCQFNNARGGDNAILITGVHMSDGPDQPITTHGMRYINCQFNGARVSENNTRPFIISGFVALTLQDVIFDNCQACNIFTENTGIGAYGFLIGTIAADPAFPFGNGQDFTFRNCIASDITGGNNAIGIFFISSNLNRTGNQGSLTNMVAENCIAERIRSASSTDRIAGIAEALFRDGITQFPRARNLFVNNCRISDVHSTAIEPSPLSAGILAESVLFPVITHNSVSDCDRGILLTGTNEIIPNGFQLAATLEDALAFPPVFIPVIGGVESFGYMNVFELPVNGGGFVFGSPWGVSDLVAEFNITTGTLILSPNVNVWNPNDPFWVQPDGTPNKIMDASVYVEDDSLAGTNVTFSGTCISNTLGVEPLTGIQYTSEAFIIAFDASYNVINRIAADLVTGQAFTINLDTIGATHVQYGYNTRGPDADPATVASLGNVVVSLFCSSASPSTTFFNRTRDNSVDINCTQIGNLNFMFPNEDLTDLGWQAGDEIFYDCQGFDAIPDLVCSTTYYAIVYRPGFAENGVVMNNEVDNCTVSGYQDDSELLDGTPATSSAWVNNFAFNNGTPASELANYDIAWTGTAPVYAGNLANYPTGSAKAFNVSLIP